MTQFRIARGAASGSNSRTIFRASMIASAGLLMLFKTEKSPVSDVLTQVREYTGQPYVNHVIAVSAIVAAYGGDQNQIVAALLHDTVEDTDTTLEQITELFGPDVAKLRSAQKLQLSPVTVS